MKILLTESYPEIKKEHLGYISTEHTIFEMRDDFDSKDIDALMIRSKTNIDTDIIDLYPNIKYIFRVGVGLDKVDKNLCKEKSIAVYNTPAANADSVADMVVGAMIMGKRNMQKHFAGIDTRFSYMGNELASQTVGIIGFGNIGKKVHSRLVAFGVKEFLVFDPFIEKADIECYAGAKKVATKQEVFEQSSIITFHIPLLPATKNFLGAEEIQRLQQDVTIINSSRGGIIDEINLVKFLADNRDAFFFADVWEEEPQFPKQELLDLENTCITPHIGAMTVEAEKKMHFFEVLR